MLLLLLIVSIPKFSERIFNDYLLDFLKPGIDIIRIKVFYKILSAPLLKVKILLLIFSMLKIYDGLIIKCDVLTTQ